MTGISLQRGCFQLRGPSYTRAMARARQIIETISCDVCGKEADEEATTIRLGWGSDQWELDVCEADRAKLSDQFDKWIENARRAGRSGGRGRSAGTSRRKSPAAANADWEYLESLGFTRHRGRKSAEEQAALDNRPR